MGSIVIHDFEKAMMYARKLRTQNIEEDIKMLEALEDNRLLALIDFHIKYGFEGEVDSFKVDEEYHLIRHHGSSDIWSEEVEELMEQAKRIEIEVERQIVRSEVEAKVYHDFCCRYLVDRKLGLTKLNHDDYLDRLLHDYFMNEVGSFELSEDALLEQEWQQFVGDEEDLVFN